MNIANRMLGLLAITIAFAVSWQVARAGEPASLTNASARIEAAFYRADTPTLLAIAGSLATQGKTAGADARYIDYYLGYANYALANLMIGHDDGKAGDRLEQAESALLQSIAADSGFAGARALLASVYGLEIALHPLKGMWLGRRISEQMDHAIELARHDPRVMLLRASNDYYKPAAFGGNKPRALLEFGQAIAQFKKYAPPDPRAPTWGEAEAYAMRASGEAAGGDIAAARRDYQAALAIAPDYVDAKAGLLHLPAPAAASRGH